MTAINSSLVELLVSFLCKEPLKYLCNEFSFILFNQTHFEVHMSLYLHITLFNFFLISIHRKFFFLWVSFLHNFNLLKCKGSTISQGCSEVKINTNQQLLRNTLFKVCYIKPKREGGRKHV